MNRIIPERYYNELKNGGHTVARYDSTGKVIDFLVGKIYSISHNKKDTTTIVLKAKCTQDCPCTLKLIY